MFQSKLATHELPHITWCTTGALSFLPLHAAGYYNDSQSRIFDFVISSYTPTLSALLSSSPRNPNLQPGLLTIGQENTKGLNRLPCTRLELAAIKEYTNKIPYLQLEGENATVDAVLKSMDKYNWVHFACHATQQTDNPGQSAFHLHDGNLTLSEIAKKSFMNKGLAFLSACQTATGSKALPDEAIHLAAGMLMAGYRSVIATMWAIQDEDAPEVARHVYEDLLDGGKMDFTKAARALHEAVTRLRNEVGEKSFERWVPFVHIGI